jgi:hypothetical protein
MRKVSTALLTMFVVACHEGGARSPMAAVAPSPVVPAPSASSRPTAAAGPSAAPTASAGPAAPAADAGMPLDDSWYARLSRFYHSYGQGPRARAAAYRELFAPQVRRFIGLRNVSLNQVLSAVETYFRSHPNPYYSLEGKPEVSSHGDALSTAEWVVSLTTPKVEDMIYEHAAL